MERAKLLEHLQRLIGEGANVLATRKGAPPGVIGPTRVDSSMFQQWGTSVVTLFTASFGPEHHLVAQAEKLVGAAWVAGDAERLLAVVKSAHDGVANEVVDIAATEGSHDPFDALDRVLDRFHRVAKQLRHRRRDRGEGRKKDARPTLHVQDEYDVQELLHALLLLFFDDVRAEPWTPGLAGASKRIDLVLWKECIAIETKMMRPSLDQSTLVDELVIDIRHYKTHPRCKTLVCFVYDPAETLPNPTAIEADLAEYTDGMEVRVRVCQR